MIKRIMPDTGYADPEMFKKMGVSQIVKFGDTLTFSGVVAARQGAPVGMNDPGVQISCVLDNIEELLHSQGLGWKNVVSATVYSPCLDQIVAELGQFSERFADHPPCLTMIGIHSLAEPDYMLEMTIIAYEI